MGAKEALLAAMVHPKTQPRYSVHKELDGIYVSAYLDDFHLLAGAAHATVDSLKEDAFKDLVRAIRDRIEEDEEQIEQAGSSALEADLLRETLRYLKP